MVQGVSTDGKKKSVKKSPSLTNQNSKPQEEIDGGGVNKVN